MTSAPAASDGSRCATYAMSVRALHACTLTEYGIGQRLTYNTKAPARRRSRTTAACLFLTVGERTHVRAPSNELANPRDDCRARSSSEADRITRGPN